MHLVTTHDNDLGDDSAVDWHAAASRQHDHCKALVYAALGDVGPLDDNETKFISQVAFDGGFLELASLLRKARAAAPASAQSPAHRMPGEAS